MTYLLIRNGNPLKRILSVVLFFLLCINILGQDIPTRPEPPRLVNDFAGLFTPQEASALESKLVAFNDSTSTQIAVVVVKDLNGYDVSQYAFALGEKWGIGQKGKNNGVLILIKPKIASSRGKAFIAPGYGLEGALPDALCKRIIENEMIPSFKQNDYYGGVDAAVNTIMSLTKGEFTADQYIRKKSSGKVPAGLIVFIILFIIILSIISKGGNRNHHSIGRRSNLPFWMLMGGLGSGRSGGGSWGGFSGGGGGGFGGFGGGSFGGGGAGGSW